MESDADIVVAADAGPGQGLGHLSRSGAVAAALAARGLAVNCYALGAGGPVRHDAIEWRATQSISDVAPPRAGGLLLLDSYSITPREAREVLKPHGLAVMHAKHRDEGPDVVVSPVPLQTPPAPRTLVLSGLEYACLRPEFWGLSPSSSGERTPSRVLVTAGGGARAKADAVARELVGLKDAQITVTGTGQADQGIEVLPAQPSMLGALSAADIVVTAGGQTALESLAAGRCTVVFIAAENQRRQAEYLESAGLIKLAHEPGEISLHVAAVVTNPKLRMSLAAGGPRAVDGFGALRVAARLASLLRPQTELQGSKHRLD